MDNETSKWEKLCKSAQGLWDETELGSQASLSKLYRFAHFWVLVWKSFARNRCPVRASALAYASLLALIPMLAVVMSVTSSILSKGGEQQINEFVVKLVASFVPPDAVPATNSAYEAPVPNNSAAADLQNSTNIAAATQGLTNTISSATVDPSQPRLPAGEQDIKGRGEIARRIHEFIQNTRSGTLGLTGGVLLIFAAISMLSRIEDTMNDIWGVQRGRSWYMRIMLYWGVITLVPILLVGAFGLTTGPHLESTRKFLATAPWIGSLLFHLLPVVVIWLTFSLFYMLMPNTKVRWQAALVGGLVGGMLFHFNNLISVLYVSRVVSNSRIYGSLGLVPVFMIGLYFGWLILLFGAQVAYAYQNRVSYLEEKQIENVNQRGREFVALRLMTCVGQRFVQGEPPLSVIAISRQLNIPSRLIQQIMTTLTTARLVAETARPEGAFLPARPLEQITCHDVLYAMRATQGQEFATRDEATRCEVFGEFNRIEAAEREVAASVTILALAHRALAKQLAAAPVDVKA